MITVYSATSCGAYISLNNEYVCHKMWTHNERLKSSAWRELQTIEFSLQSFATLLEDSHVKWFTDNQSVAKIVEVGSMKLDLHLMAKFFSIFV